MARYYGTSLGLEGLDAFLYTSAENAEKVRESGGSLLPFLTGYECSIVIVVSGTELELLWHFSYGEMA